MTTIPPLSNSQQLFLQRLLVASCMTDADTQQLYDQIKQKFASIAPTQYEDEEDEKDEGYMGTDLEHCLCLINGSLVPGFNLEVCTVSLPAPYDEDDEENEENGEEEDRPKKKRAPLVKYHAIVNRGNDGVAQKHAFPASKGGPHDMAYYRLVIEKIVERGVDLLENGEGTGVGCPGSMNRMDLINLRTELEGAHEGKLTIAQTENALEVLEGEKWLVRVAPPSEGDSDDEEDGGGEEEEDRPKKKRKGKKRGSSTGSRRKSLKGTFYGIGPRSFMECGELLQKAGLPGDRMPQSILHRI
ncbi:hypothetical protein ACHAXT_007717 [Thalassiosira profunda]